MFLLYYSWMPDQVRHDKSSCGWKKLFLPRIRNCSDRREPKFRLSRKNNFFQPHHT